MPSKFMDAQLKHLNGSPVASVRASVWCSTAEGRASWGGTLLPKPGLLLSLTPNDYRLLLPDAGEYEIMVKSVSDVGETAGVQASVQFRGAGAPPHFDE